ncbi:MAG: hypothetical protein ACPLY7_01965 [Microgenomates group bacterium]
MANIYGLLTHPSKTILKIYQKKDWSQTILIFGLPIYFWVGTIFSLAALRFLLGIRGNLGRIAQIFIALTTFLAGTLFIYLLLSLFRFCEYLALPWAGMKQARVKPVRRRQTFFFLKQRKLRPSTGGEASFITLRKLNKGTER